MNLLMLYRIFNQQKPPSSDHGKKVYKKLLKEINAYYPCRDVCPLTVFEGNVRELIKKAIKYLKKYGYRD